MMHKFRGKLSLLLILLTMLAAFTGCSTAVQEPETIEVELPQLEEAEQSEEPSESTEETVEIDEDGYYTSAEDVALYLHTYGRLPDNYITKSEASKLGWDPQKGNLWDVTDKMSIGGDRFSNREKLLPEEDGRIYFECDINFEGGYRGSERLVYSNDGLIFYTEDHYESFEQLY